MSAQRKYEVYDLDVTSFEGAPLHGLSEVERQIVIAMRVWVKGARARVCPLRLLAPRFVIGGRLHLLVPFHGFMLSLAQSAARKVDVAGSEVSDITHDEALILAALACAKSRDLRSVRVTLMALVCQNDLTDVTHKAVQLALIMG